MTFSVLDIISCSAAIVYITMLIMWGIQFRRAARFHRESIELHRTSVDRHWESVELMGKTVTTVTEVIMGVQGDLMNCAKDLTYGFELRARVALPDRPIQDSIIFQENSAGMRALMKLIPPMVRTLDGWCPLFTISPMPGTEDAGPPASGGVIIEIRPTGTRDEELADDDQADDDHVAEADTWTDLERSWRAPAFRPDLTHPLIPERLGCGCVRARVDTWGHGADCPITIAARVNGVWNDSDFPKGVPGRTWHFPGDGCAVDDPDHIDGLTQADSDGAH